MKRTDLIIKVNKEFRQLGSSARLGLASGFTMEVIEADVDYDLIPDPFVRRKVVENVANKLLEDVTITWRNNVCAIWYTINGNIAQLLGDD